MDEDGLESEPKIGASPTEQTAIWSVWDVFLVAISTVLFLLAGLWGLSLAQKAGLLGKSATGQYSLLFSLGMGWLEATSIFVSIWGLGIFRKRYHWSAVGFQIPRVEWIFASVLLGFLAIPLSGLIAALIQWLLKKPLENPQLEFLLPNGFSWFAMLGMLLMGGILVPIAEEMFFRGLLYSWMRNHWKPWLAIPVSSLIFGALHGDISVGGAAFVLGIMLAWVYERSQSVLPGIIIHILNNSIKILVLYVYVALGLPLE